MRGVILDFDTLGPSDLDLTDIYALPVKWEIHQLCKPSEVAKLIVDADIVLINKSPIRELEIRQAKRLKFISIFATGTDIIDLDAARKCNVIVSNAVRYGTASVVQHAWALILNLTTKMDNYRRAATDGRWQNSGSFCVMDYPISELCGRTLGVIGAGELGLGVAKIAKAFGMFVVFASLPGREHSEQKNRIPLHELLAKSDIVSLHCPLTPMTHQLMSYREFSLMKKTSILINTARGALVDEDALKEALIAGEIAGAATDVLSQEPPQDGNILLDEAIPNLIITPHVAWIARESRQRLLDQVAGNVAAYLAGEPRNRVC
jgi:glycerate dehydrogenase